MTLFCQGLDKKAGLRCHFSEKVYQFLYIGIAPARTTLKVVKMARLRPTHTFRGKKLRC